MRYFSVLDLDIPSKLIEMHTLRLSEASKMLRKLEKGLNSAKLKSQAAEASLSPQFSAADPRPGPTGDGHQGLPVTHHVSAGPPGSRVSDREFPPIHSRYGISQNPRAEYDNECEDDGIDQEQEDDGDLVQNPNGIFPAKLINKENQRNPNLSTKSIVGKAIRGGRTVVTQKRVRHTHTGERVLQFGEGLGST